MDWIYEQAEVYQERYAGKLKLMQEMKIAYLKK